MDGWLVTRLVESWGSKRRLGWEGELGSGYNLVGWVVLLVCGHGEGVVYVPCWGLRQKLCRSALDSFLGFLGVWAISGDVTSHMLKATKTWSQASSCIIIKQYCTNAPYVSSITCMSHMLHIILCFIMKCFV
jgi:hypothetical protein